MSRKHAKNPEKGLSPEEIRNIITEYNAGMSAEAIAIEMYLYPAKIMDIIEGRGIQKHGRSHAVSKEQLLRAAVQNRWNKAKTAKALGITRSTVYALSRAYGLDAQFAANKKAVKPSRTKEEVEQAIRTCHGDRQESAAMLRIHPVTLYNLSRRYGLTGLLVKRSVRK